MRYRIRLGRLCVWLALASLLSAYLVAFDFPPICHLALFALAAGIAEWEALKAFLSLRLGASADVAHYALAMACGLLAAAYVYLYLPRPEPEPASLFAFIFGFREIVRDALEEALPKAITLSLLFDACLALALLAMLWTIAANVIRWTIARRRARREASSSAAATPNEVRRTLRHAST